MRRIENVEFSLVRTEREGKVFEVMGLLVKDVPELRGRGIRTKSKKDWNRVTFYDDKTGSILFLSLEPETDKYLLEMSVRVGRGYERHEASMEVTKIREGMGKKPTDLEEVAAYLASQAVEVHEGFDYPPRNADRKISNPKIDPDDILASGRGAAGLSLEQRQKVREILALEPTPRSKLPDGVFKIRRK